MKLKLSALCFWGAGIVLLLVPGCAREQLVGIQGLIENDTHTGGDDPLGDSDSTTDSPSETDSQLLDSDTSVAVGCDEAQEVPLDEFGPADIIWAVDNTPSMTSEREFIEQYINGFYTQITQSQIDVRIVLVSCLPGDCTSSAELSEHSGGICIDPPLGNDTGCESIEGDTDGVTDDNNMPIFTHVNHPVSNKGALGALIDAYPSYKDVLREHSQKHFVVVSNNTDNTSVADFNSGILGLDGESFDDYMFHGIFAYYSQEAACEMNPVHPCCDYAASSGEGVPYKDLVSMTDGAQGDLCEQDFQSTMILIADSVVDNPVLACDWDIPPVPDGSAMDSGHVNLLYGNGVGNKKYIGYVDSPSYCIDVEQGWYYDDVTEPSRILTCPRTCSWIQSGINSQLRIEFGCSTFDATTNK